MLNCLTASFAERDRFATATTAGVLEQVVPAAHRLVPGADLVSVTLRPADGTFHTPVETAPAATELDQVQYDTGRRPVRGRRVGFGARPRVLGRPRP